VIKLRNRTCLRIAVGTVFICVFILALMYPVISVGREDRIHFLKSPKAMALFTPPSGKEVDIMWVSAAVFEDSSYGSFKTVMYGYESYDYVDGNLIMIHDEFHWFTDNWRAGKICAELSAIVYPSSFGVPIEYVSNDVTLARIDVISSEDELSVAVFKEGKIVLTAAFLADTAAPIQSRLESGSPLPPELYLSVEAYFPLSNGLATGIEVGDFQWGRFEPIDTELYDSSLLP
jgi:hypothetical protein